MGDKTVVSTPIIKLNTVYAISDSYLVVLLDITNHPIFMRYPFSVMNTPIIIAY